MDDKQGSSERQEPQSEATIQTKPVSQIKATKQNDHTIRVKEDNETCDITGMAITKDGRRLMVDRNNEKIKLFTPDMNFVSAVSVPDLPWDIAVISDSEAVVTTDKNSLMSLDISGSQLQIMNTSKVSYDVSGITKYNDKIVISSGSDPPSVRLIDLTGNKEFWSMGQKLLKSPWYVTSHNEGRSSTVILTDCDNDMLTVLNGETGKIIIRRELQWKWPRGVTTDSSGNIYVCYCWSHEVAVLSEDLYQQKILLSTNDGLSKSPQAIVYDDNAQQLLIAHSKKNAVSTFKLT